MCIITNHKKGFHTPQHISYHDRCDFLPFIISVPAAATSIKGISWGRQSWLAEHHGEIPAPRGDSLWQNGRHFADDIFKCIFLNENVWIPIRISLKFVPKGPINNILALVQIMAWRRSGVKPLSEPMMASLPTHISVTRPLELDIFWEFSKA